MEHYNSLNWRDHIKRLEGAYAPSTVRVYYTDTRALVDWCRIRQFEWHSLTPHAYCEYLDTLVARGLSYGSIQRKFYSARRLYSLTGFGDPTRHPDVGLAMRRIGRALTARPRQARGLTRVQLEDFIASLPDTPWGLRDRAILSLGFELLARRSELTALRTGDVTWRADGTLEVLVRRSKADQLGMGRLCFTSRRAAGHVESWLAWRGMEIGPLFCAIYRGKPIDRSLSEDSIRDTVKNAARAAGYDASIVREFSAHSLRVGAAQELLRRGYDGTAIMRAGGWRSTNVLARYLAFAEHNVWQSI